MKTFIAFSKKIDSMQSSTIKEESSEKEKYNSPSSVDMSELVPFLKGMKANQDQMMSNQKNILKENTELKASIRELTSNLSTMQKIMENYIKEEGEFIASYKTSTEAESVTEE